MECNSLTNLMIGSYTGIILFRSVGINCSHTFIHIPTLNIILHPICTYTFTHTCAQINIYDIDIDTVDR